MTAIYDTNSIAFTIAPQPNGNSRITFFADKSGVDKAAEVIGITIDVQSNILSSQIDASLSFEKLLKSKQYEILDAIKEAQRGLPGAAIKFGSILSTIGNVTDVGLLALNTVNGTYNWRTRNGQVSIATDVASIVLNGVVGNATRNIVFGSVAAGAVVGGPIGAGIGLLVGLTAAAGGTAIMIAKGDDIKEFIGTQIGRAYDAVLGGSESNNGRSPNLSAEDFLPEIVVTGRRLAATGQSISKRVILVNPSAVANDPSLKSALQAAESDSGPLAGYLNRTTGTVNVAGVSGLQITAVPGAIVATVSKDNTQYTVSVDPATLPSDPTQSVSAILDLLNRKGVDALKVGIIPTIDYGAYEVGSTLGQLVGSQLGSYLGGKNPFLQTLSSSALGTITQNLSQAIVAGGFGKRVITDGNKITTLTEGVLDDFGQEFISNLRSAAVGTVSSLLSLELGRTLGVNGFGGELLANTTSTVIGQVVNNAITLAQGGGASIGGNLFNGLSGSKLFGSINETGNLTGGLATSALASFLGAKLGSIVISPTNTTGAVLSSIGSSAGAIAGTAGSSLAIGALTQLGWFGGPLVGAFTGYVLGSLLGKFFGGKPKRPQASQEIILNFSTGYWDLGQTYIRKNGNIEIAKDMAGSAQSTINGLVSTVVGGADIAPNINTSLAKQRYRVTTGASNPFEVHTWTGSDWSSAPLYAGTGADEAVESGTLKALRDTKIRGGNIIFKRAIYRSGNTGPVADDLVTLLGDLQVAEDLARYNRDPEPVNRLIASDPNSAFAASWAITFLRAEELKLNAFQPSDFYGGLVGFSESFDFGSGVRNGVLSAGYEKLDVTFEGTSVRIATRDATGPFGLLSASNNITDPVQAARSVLIPNFAASTGYTAWGSSGTNGNDIQVATGNGAAVISFAANGDDIVVGSNYDDQLYGQAGWDWLDGGQGNDYLDGGTEDDVLLGRAGVDRIVGGTGNDYLFGGEGDDYFNAWIGGAVSGALNGNDGNDTLVGGTGIDALFGDNGDDVFIIDQDGASAPDYMDGGGGSDTASYERFTTGVNIDMGANPATNASPSLASGQYLYPGQSVYSPDNRFRMVYQGDGNLVVYGPSGVVWASGTNGTSTGFLAMQTAGNLVLYNGSNQAVWATDGGGNPGAAFYLQNTGRMSVFTTMGREIWNIAAGNLNGSATQPYASLLPGANLYPGQSIYSPDGRFRLVYQGDGNLVLYGPGGQGMWSSNTAGTSPLVVKMQAEGNLVIYNSASQAVWATSGGGYNGAGLFVTDTGRLSLLMPNQQEIWTSNTGGGAAYAKRIYSDIWQSIENVTGSQYNDILVGGAAANVIKGLGGNDQLRGEGGDDILEGGVGADTLNGGDGVDTASYMGSSSGVVVNLTTGAALGGDASGDSFVSIESLRGSKYNDELTGNAGANVIEGMGGDDTLVMTTGYDTLNGGDGLDTLDASGVAAAVTVSGSYAYLSGTYSLLSNIESFVGSAFADSLSGGAGDKIYDGGAGNDQLSGSTGSDTYLFGRGDGSDSVTESSGGANQIVLKDGINWRDVAIGGANVNVQNGNLVVSLRGTSDQVVVGGNFSYVTSGTSVGIHNHKIKTIDLGGASALDVGMIDWTPAGAADDAANYIIGGQNLADIIFAYGGNDYITVSGYTASEYRENIVYAGDGNDEIVGAGGDDQYVFERGNGIDTLTDVGGLDTIVMGPSVAAEDVIYDLVATDANGNSDLYIGLRDPNDPSLNASHVADRIRIVGGGAIYENLTTGQQTRRTVEYVRVAGQEIDLLKANISWTNVTYTTGTGPYAPVALDLDGDGLELRSVDGSRMSIVEADGSIIRMGWLGSDDGFLALDRNGDGAIDRISEISFVNDLKGAKTDLEGLAAYDDNADGKLDAADKKWAEFRVWKDKDQDGYGGKSELLTLEQAGVKSISLKGQATGFTAADGQDNIVLATTEVEWIDPTRTGAGYDVLLGAQQVRTDDGGKAAAQGVAAARGRGAGESIDASLYGVQALTADQIAALKLRPVAPDTANGGGFFRVETLVNSGKASVANGLLTIAPTLATTLANLVRPIGNILPGFLSPFAGSDWTQLGSVKRGQADTSTDKVLFRPYALTADQQATLTAAQARNVEQEALAAQMAAERAATDAADAAQSALVQAQGGIDPRRSAEAAGAADGFEMLGAETDDETAASMAPNSEVSSEVNPTPAAETAETSGSRSQDGVTTPTGKGEPANDVSPGEGTAPASASIKRAGQPSTTADDEVRSSGDTDTEDGLAEVSDYAVTISAANARLVQALASFGAAPAMMANYRGLNVANDAGASLLTVDALPSVHRMAAIA